MNPTPYEELRLAAEWVIHTVVHGVGQHGGPATMEEVEEALAHLQQVMDSQTKCL